MNELVKIEIRTEDEEGDIDVETPWATALGDNRYKLDNYPFFAYGVSWEDVVEAKPDNDGFPVFTRVLEKSGNKTIRIVFDPPVEDNNESGKALEQIVEKGCSYEGLNPAYIVVNIPPISILTVLSSI